eukprot:c26318_g1_i1.p1 GENE.c26318_g1_i1~~c26318_g1_i1.p1  ORF type:complete len:430 (-),score=91.93 c26318_g1_i1:59-1165(-)
MGRGMGMGRRRHHIHPIPVIVNPELPILASSCDLPLPVSITTQAPAAFKTIQLSSVSSHRPRNVALEVDQRTIGMVEFPNAVDICGETQDQLCSDDSIVKFNITFTRPISVSSLNIWLMDASGNCEAKQSANVLLVDVEVFGFEFPTADEQSATPSVMPTPSPSVAAEAGSFFINIMFGPVRSDPFAVIFAVGPIFQEYLALNETYVAVVGAEVRPRGSTFQIRIVMPPSRVLLTESLLGLGQCERFMQIAQSYLPGLNRVQVLSVNGIPGTPVDPEQDNDNEDGDDEAEDGHHPRRLFNILYLSALVALGLIVLALVYRSRRVVVKKARSVARSHIVTHVTEVPCIIETPTCVIEDRVVLLRPVKEV